MRTFIEHRFRESCSDDSSILHQNCINEQPFSHAVHRSPINRSLKSAMEGRAEASLDVTDEPGVDLKKTAVTHAVLTSSYATASNYPIRPTEQSFTLATDAKLESLQQHLSETQIGDGPPSTDDEDDGPTPNCSNATPSTPSWSQSGGSREGSFKCRSPERSYKSPARSPGQMAFRTATLEQQSANDEKPAPMPVFIVASGKRRQSALKSMDALQQQSHRPSE